MSLAKDDVFNGEQYLPKRAIYRSVFEQNGSCTSGRLMDELAVPPFGVKRGVFPTVFLHYYLLHRPVPGAVHHRFAVLIVSRTSYTRMRSHGTWQPSRSVWCTENLDQRSRTAQALASAMGDWSLPAG